jgi:hypothetical protein
MSNSERWDHSGYDNMLKDDKNSGNRPKQKPISNKYKDNNQYPEKIATPDYIDGNRKNKPKYYNKTINDSEIKDDKFKKPNTNKKNKRHNDSHYDETDKQNFLKSNSLNFDEEMNYRKANNYLTMPSNFYNKPINNYQTFMNPPNYTITVTEADPNENIINGEDENMIMQQNIILTNENQKNKKNFKNVLDTLKAVKKSKKDGRSSDNTLSMSDEGSNKTNTPHRRLSGSAKSGNSNFAIPMMAGNIVQNMYGSPINQEYCVPIPNLNNPIRMPAGFVTNSPLRQNEQYIYPNSYNRNVNPQMMIRNMGMSPIDPNFNHYNYNMIGMNQGKNQQMSKNFRPDDNQNFNRNKMYMQNQPQFGNKFYPKNIMNQPINNQNFNFKPQYNNVVMQNRNPQMNIMYRMKPVNSDKNIVGSLQRNSIETHLYENVRLPNKTWRNHNNIQDNFVKKEILDTPSPIAKDASYENEDKAVLQIIIKLIDKEEIISLTKSEDPLKVSKEFCLKNQLNDDLIKPIQHKIKQALKSIDLILDHNISTAEEQSLIEVQNIYNQIPSNDSFLNLSCMTDIGDTCLHLDIDENIQLNMSR